MIRKYWNYRAIQHRARSVVDTDWVGLHEVYYDDQGRVTNYTEAAMVVADDLEDLVRVLNRIQADLAKHPVLEEPVFNCDSLNGSPPKA